MDIEHNMKKLPGEPKKMKNLVRRKAEELLPKVVKILEEKKPKQTQK